LSLSSDKLVSKFAFFKFNLHRYVTKLTAAGLKLSAIAHDRFAASAAGLYKLNSVYP
jgi:hypothetical protein